MSSGLFRTELIRKHQGFVHALKFVACFFKAMHLRNNNSYLLTFSLSLCETNFCKISFIISWIFKLHLKVYNLWKYLALNYFLCIRWKGIYSHICCMRSILPLSPRVKHPALHCLTHINSHLGEFIASCSRRNTKPRLAAELDRFPLAAGRGSPSVQNISE